MCRQRLVFVISLSLSLSLSHRLLHSNSSLSWPLRCRIAFDVAHGMNALHSFKPPLLHRDLKRYQRKKERNRKREREREREREKLERQSNSSFNSFFLLPFSFLFLSLFQSECVINEYQ